MTQLLVDTPSGAQEVIVVGQGGGYYDQSKVLWDERKDGPLPSITLGGMVRQGSSLAFNQARMDASTAALKTTPESLTPRQFRQALNHFGYRATVDAAIAGATQDIKDWYEYATSFERHHPIIVLMAQQMGYTSAQMDELWSYGATL